VAARLTIYDRLFGGRVGGGYGRLLRRLWVSFERHGKGCRLAPVTKLLAEGLCQPGQLGDGYVQQ
jgi:hypothetical protein